MGKSKMVKCPLSKLSREHEAVDVRKGGSKSQKQKKKKKKKKKKKGKAGQTTREIHSDSVGEVPNNNSFPSRLQQSIIEFPSRIEFLPFHFC
jgi:hypothetical protein